MKKGSRTARALAGALLALFAASAPSAWSAEPEGPLVLTREQGKYPLGRHMAILADESGALTISEASSPAMASRYAPSGFDVPSFGFNSTDYWVRVDLVSRLGRPEEWFLELDYPHMDLFEVYYTDTDGRPAVKRSGDARPFAEREIDYRNIVFTVPVAAEGRRTLYLHFAGSCSKQFPVILWSPGAFAEKVIEEKFTLGIYYGIILVMIVYNLFIFVFIRDRSYLLYVIYICSYGLVQLAYNGMAYKYLWPSLPAWHTISLPFLIGMAIFWMAIFSRSFLHARDYSRTANGSLLAITGVGVAIMTFSVFGNYLIAITSAMVLMIAASFVILFSATTCMKRGYRPARFFLTAWIMFLAGMLLIAMNKLNIVPSLFLTEYAIQIGSALEVTLISVALADRINMINQEKKDAQAATIQAQEKYKLLVEGSDDIIFSLDGKLNLITANQAILEHLKISPETATGMNFMDLIYDATPDAAVSKKILRMKLDEFSATREPLVFRAMFISSIASEPREMDVRLHYITIEGKNEILGKATGIEEDALTQSIERESQEYRIGNYIMSAEEVTHRITRVLRKYVDAKQANLVRIALREIIINSIEHGNLDISFDEKTDAIMNDSYFEFIALRRQDPKYRNRRVRIRYSINDSRAAYIISDEGGGFDHSRVLGDNSSHANKQLLAHGRGISMARSIFDVVFYNKKGTEAVLVKHLTNGK
ncbi:MAG: ATP-binding protein [Spirochaetes bacterium]|nr:ATP-binding protein [Spirochaetota bacterium]